MKPLTSYQNFYFVGIGGIGMSALARYFKASGKNVLGYDKTVTKLTSTLVSEGIDTVSYTHLDVYKRQAVYCSELWFCYCV